MKDKKFIFASILVSIFLLTVGLTYAYFSLTVSGNDVAETINVSTTKIGLIYTDGKEVKSNNIEPNWTTTKTITVENTGNEEAYYALGWQKLYNEIQKDELVIRSTCTSSGVTGGTCSNTDNVVIPQTSEVTAETNKVLYPYKENVLILPGETHTYTVTIEFINYDDKAQNYNQGKRFYGVLGAAESSGKVQTFSNYLIKNYQEFGLTKIEQEATENQNYVTTEYRYQGGDPNNYISFNEEEGAWRIIGIFEVETPNADGTYTKERKAKLIRNSISTYENYLLVWNDCVASITMINNNSDDKNGTCDRDTPGYAKKNKNINDWTIANLQTNLNNGGFYNNERTSLSSGLTDMSKELISTTKWYLGNANVSSNVTDIYKAERGSKIENGNQTIWNGKVALMYPSDYMYASENCTSISGSSFSSCTSDNWLDNGYNTHSKYWTLNSPISSSTLALTGKHSKAKFMVVDNPGEEEYYSPAIIIVGNKDISYNKIRSAGSYGDCFDREIEIRPVVYLSSSVEYESGDGSSSNPFVVK